MFAIDELALYPQPLPAENPSEYGRQLKENESDLEAMKSLRGVGVTGGGGAR